MALRVEPEDVDTDTMSSWSLCDYTRALGRFMSLGHIIKKVRQLPSFLGAAISVSGHSPVYESWFFMSMPRGKVGEPRNGNCFSCVFCLGRLGSTRMKWNQIAYLSLFHILSCFQVDFLKKMPVEEGEIERKHFFLDASGVVVSYSECRCFLDRLPRDTSRFPESRFPRFLSECITVL